MPWRLKDRSSLMSRTDVHAPYRVKMKDPGWRALFVEEHDHSQGECDLAKFLAAKYWIGTQCSMNFLWDGHNIHCGCGMCTNHIGRQLGRRRERHQTRQALRSHNWDALELAQREEMWVMCRTRGEEVKPWLQNRDQTQRLP